MIFELLKAFGLIFIAEMGDKTQILAMAFATKYKMKHVLIGIAIGAFLNHAIAIALGSVLNTFIDLSALGITAGFLFILFALWTLRFEKEDEVNIVSKYGPIITVALAFFIGELGDKTQLTAFALATEANYPLFVLIGTVSGMVVTGLIGIYVGIKLGSKIPEFYIKLGASLVFLAFGYSKLITNLPSLYLTPLYYVPFTILVLTIAYSFGNVGYKLHKVGETLYQKTARELYEYYHNIETKLDEICLGEEVCGKCSDYKCIVGYTKRLIRDAQNGIESNEPVIKASKMNKSFDQDKVIESLKLTIHVLKDNPQNKQYKKLHQVRMNFEEILTGHQIEKFNSLPQYLAELEKLDKSLIKKIV